MSKKLVIASHNQGKLKEMKALFADKSVEVLSSSDFNLEEPEEDGATFEENALIKALYTFQETGLPSIADDSGLCVDALKGEPGIYSARWAGKNKDFGSAMKMVEERVGQSKDLSAQFICVLAYVDDQQERVFRGEVTGQLTFPPRGDFGFGYDPIFVPEGDTKTFAEIRQDEKQAMSHRARAFDLFLKAELI